MYCIYKIFKCFKYIKRKYLGKEVDDIFYFYFKNISVVLNYKKCSCSNCYKLFEIKLNVLGFLNNINIVDMYRYVFKCLRLKLMLLFFGDCCGKIIGINFKLILKGFFFWLNYIL